jgi:nicotinate-nucleotide adenylyltransferase
MRLGVLGGAFNPVHYGHLRAAEEAREALGLDRVLFVPSGDPPLKSVDVAGVGHRLAMARLAAAGNPAFEVLDIEARRPGKSYTVLTLEELGALYPGAGLFFVLGIDAFLDLPHWREPERLVALADYVVVSRPPRRFSELAGSSFLVAEQGALAALDRGGAGLVKAGLKGGREAHLLRATPMEISSTNIRALARAGRSLRYLLPEAVESYIMSHGLFA